MKHVVFYSGGIGSYITAKRVIEKHPLWDVLLLFTDTRSEDPDLYRFIAETSEYLMLELVTLADGRNLWELFNDNGMIANTMADFCSRILKRQLSNRWVREKFPDPRDVKLYFGIDHSEEHRLKKIRNNWSPYTVEAPLCEPPHMTKCEMIKECERDGIDPPGIYDEGFPHNNCNGFCVKAGHAHFLHLLKNRPKVFMENATKEQEFRDRTGKDVAVMKDRRGGTTKPLPMLEFKRQVESGEREVDPRDWGKGCQCFTPDEEVI